MLHFLNRPSLKNRRRELRKNQTDAERILWRQLRNRQMRGLKCPKIHLAIEADGSHHFVGLQKKYDEERTRFLHAYHIHIIRFGNNEILQNIAGVMQKLDEVAETLIPTPPSLLFSKEEE